MNDDFMTPIKMLHFNDSIPLLLFKDLNYNILFKIRPFVDSFRNNFKLIDIKEFLAINEIIIPFKGISQMPNEII